MSEIKFKNEIESLIENISKIPEEFFIRTDGNKYRVIWFINRQKPSIEASYNFDQERFGITADGKIIWGFDSGCSCPSPWSQEDYGDDSYNLKTWKEFETTPESSFDADWEDECYNNLKDYLLLLKEDISPLDVLKINNSEIRRYLIKRVGYENIKNHANVEVLHIDGNSELLLINGEKYVKVKDSSTEREYLLYVEDHCNNCKQAIAWTFGLKEEEYNPLIET